MPSQSVIACCKIIAAQKWKIAFAESATAGRMCAEFSLVEGSGEILRGGICCYEIFVKECVLNVAPELISNFTAESPEVTEAVAQHASTLFKSDITVAVTGLTSPGGSETPEKPVGTMFVHILFPGGEVQDHKVFLGNAESIVLQTIDWIAELISKNIGD